MFINLVQYTVHVVSVQSIGYKAQKYKEQEHFPAFRPRRGATTVDLPFAVRQRPLLFPGKKGGEDGGGSMGNLSILQTTL